MKRKLHDNLRRIGDRIAAACERSKRSPKDITLVVVTKSVGVDVIRQLLELGQSELGESRVQVLTKRAAMINEQRTRWRGTGEELSEPNWHMVGHLQRNKVKAILPWVHLIHSVDSLRLAEEIDRQAERIDRTINVLLQVNAADEAQKHGVAVGAVDHLAEQIVTLPHLRLCGLMAMAPLGADASELAWAFGRTGEIFSDLRREPFIPPEFRHLSMGMSEDFETAIENGATMIRLGTALFEGVEAG